MVASPPMAGGIYFVDVSRADQPQKLRRFVVVMPREDAVDAVTDEVGEGWNVTLSKRRVTSEQAGAMNLGTGERLVRELSEIHL